MEKSLTLLVGLLTAAAHVRAQDWLTAKNERERYTASFPRTWTVWPQSGGNGALSATTYPPGRAPEGGVVPPGQAAITIFSRAAAGRTLADWIDESSAYLGTARRRNVTIQAPGLGGPASFVEVESRDDVAPGVYQQVVTDYFALGDRLFAVRLEFSEADRRERTYRSVLGRVVRSVRLAPARP